MPTMSVDRSDPRPLYAQIAAELRAEIRDRTIAPGDTLPSEAALQERFGVSRSVVRQALATLEEEGVVRRDPGRAAVATAGVEHRRLVQRVTGLFDQFSRSGLDLATRVVRLEEAAPPAHVARHLGTRAVLRLERVRSVRDDPLSYVRTWLPADRVPGLSADMLTDASLHRLLAARFGAQPVSGRRQVRAVPADSAIAAALGVAAGAPLLLLEGSTFDQHGAPLEWFESWHRSDRVVFDIEADESAEQLRLHPGTAFAEPPPGTAPASAAGADTPRLDRARALAAELRAELDRLAAEQS
ncbi:GntR family transcriptional regulator [Streptomonospora nanhaiensis]|uniref:GntR family transcriptional regulator n=1 Tax=Streptomonospora nanhaiensis TaxID=1323731 RepID=UPI001C38E86C|nr:GntR family transcriptional regulator [Streptomonospora nanhaiensis]MBV2366967.1 GntR family transcriptional regulator [Streptomonospora nanhaiensis]MBX9389405.1 GntR family transcriptional regulator [Streptomonospora nanhaiensis]